MCKNGNISYIRNLKYVYACCSCELIINNECLVYIHILDFSNHWCNKKRIVSYIIIMISNMVKFAVRGSMSLKSYNIYFENRH